MSGGCLETLSFPCGPRDPRKNARAMSPKGHPPAAERTVEDLAVVDPDASGPTDVIELPPLEPPKQPSSIAPLALDVAATAPRGIFRESVNFVQAPVRPRKSSHLAWLAIASTAGIGLMALIAGITIAVESSSSPAAIDARPVVHVARRADEAAARSLVVTEPSLATRKGRAQRH